MKIIGINTIRVAEFPNLCFVEIRTDDGLTGLGETFLDAGAVDAYIHERAAGVLLGEDPQAIEAHAARLSGPLGRGGTGIETRGNSAVNIALWDLAGKIAGQPLYQLLGGACRDQIRIYNTCAGYRYIRDTPEQQVRNWGLPDAGGGGDGPYEDLDGFLHRADELAGSLLAEQITAMKIWPFDAYAEATSGHGISARDLDAGLQPLRKIRDGAGTAMEVMIELHSLWDVPTAIEIAAALEPYAPSWLEDPVPASNPRALAAVARATTIPVAASETLGGLWAFRDIFESEAARIAICDLSWAGGISEARRIADLAAAYQLPVTLHDCTGPVVLAASVHLAVHLPNTLIQETVRAYYTSWYRQLVTGLPGITGGYARPAPGPGLGVMLRPEVRQRSDAIIHASTIERRWRP